MDILLLLQPGMTIPEILRHLNRKHRHGSSISPSSSHSSLSIESGKSNQATGGGWDMALVVSCDYHMTCLFFSLATAEAVAAAKKAQQEMYGALLSRREELVDTLEKKLTSYKELLIKEMVLSDMYFTGYCFSFQLFS